METTAMTAAEAAATMSIYVLAAGVIAGVAYVGVCVAEWQLAKAERRAKKEALTAATVKADRLAG